jgi:hypothetical protein
MKTIAPKPTVNADLTNLPQLYGTVFLKTFAIGWHFQETFKDSSLL